MPRAASPNKNQKKGMENRRRGIFKKCTTYANWYKDHIAVIIRRRNGEFDICFESKPGFIRSITPQCVPNIVGPDEFLTLAAQKRNFLNSQQQDVQDESPVPSFSKMPSLSSSSNATGMLTPPATLDGLDWRGPGSGTHDLILPSQLLAPRHVVSTELTQDFYIKSE
jgi:hypothetical protein